MTKTIQTETGALALSYALTERLEEGVMQYGITITAPGECAEAPSISPNREEVAAFLNTLADNNVTPTALPELVEDYLGR